MTQYIKQYIDRFRRQGETLTPQFFQELYEELRRFDPRDFDPAVQELLVTSRQNIRFAADQPRGMHVNQMATPLDGIVNVLDHYRGAGSGGVRRSFSYISDVALKAIIERDYADLTLKLFPSGAWKSTVVMAGSILESMLFDVLSNPKRLGATNASPKAAKAKGGVPIDIAANPDKWKLIHLIEVAVDIGVLPPKRADTIDQVMREYRNFVHPHVEKAAQHECSEAEAGLAKYGLDGVCDHLERTL